ncbi:MAG: hypothetical protein JSS83_23215 [Cyanobacteria bacterium SZAS LIN-3]|nr:hypothetical protein [Cyanobacteria bacterium SZAS LIN-3]
MDTRASFLVIGIPETSRYNDVDQFARLLGALTSSGFKPRTYRASGCEDIQIYLSFSEEADSRLLHRMLSVQLMHQGFELAPHTLIIYSTEEAFPLPLQSGFAWLNDNLTVKLKRDDISLESALALFLADMARSAVAPAVLLESAIAPVSIQPVVELDHDVADAGAEVSDVDCAVNDQPINLAGESAVELELQEQLPLESGSVELLEDLESECESQTLLPAVEAAEDILLLSVGEAADLTSVFSEDEKSAEIDFSVGDSLIEDLSSDPVLESATLLPPPAIELDDVIPIAGTEDCEFEARAEAEPDNPLDFRTPELDQGPAVIEAEESVLLAVEPEAMIEPDDVPSSAGEHLPTGPPAVEIIDTESDTTIGMQLLLFPVAGVRPVETAPKLARGKRRRARSDPEEATAMSAADTQKIFSDQNQVKLNIPDPDPGGD